MNKTYLTFFLGLLTLTPLTIQADTSPINLNDVKWPPFFFSNHEKGKMGLGKEILTTCISELNYEVHLKFLPIKRTHYYMKSGDIDISVYSYNKNRKNFVYYGNEPIFTSQYGLVTKRSDNIKIEKLDDIKPYIFGHLDGLTHTKEIRNILKIKQEQEQISKGYDIDAMFKQLLATPQRFQIMANSKETLKWRAKQLGITKQIKIHNLNVQEKAYYVTISKFSKNIRHPKLFLTRIDRCIQKLKETGQYQKMAQIYGL
ncbi:transporter substrate-binding domain-containing protein [Colwellia sp. UCD-KL20]|uniref:substrate-binding periplasmic protein n=1 Tax=Colwellia sp. UCD-KL20 TaxID=1917165 RepID=UPI000970703C|nr:transporter substrate-binding domain-containing protein [Colwellia sp. UCD-KL20]